MKQIVVLVLTLLLVSCATPYQQVGTTVAGGYSSNRLSNEVFEVRFDGNGFTQPKRARDFALLRAAEIALEHNYPYFVIIGNHDKTSTEIIRGDSTSYTTGTITTFGDYGTYQGTTTTFSNDIPVTKPSLALRIFCFESPDTLGKHAGIVYTAQEIKRELRQKYGLDNP
jgi:hypothetical protein